MGFSSPQASTNDIGNPCLFWCWLGRQPRWLSFNHWILLAMWCNPSTTRQDNMMLLHPVPRLNIVRWLETLPKSSGCVLFSRTWESLFFLSLQFTVIIISPLSLFTTMSFINGQRIMRLIDTSTIFINGPLGKKFIVVLFKSCKNTCK